MQTITPFDTTRHHIYVELFIEDANGIQHGLDAVIDTGAPKTEFSDKSLFFLGLIDSPVSEVAIKPGLQTQKYAKVSLPSIIVCSQQIQNLDVMVAKFDPSWGIAALIGLDFFRKYRVTIDYKVGHLITEPLS